MKIGQIKRSSEEIQKILSDRLLGLTFSEINKKYNIDRSTVIYHLKKAGYYNDSLKIKHNLYNVKQHKFLRFCNKPISESTESHNIALQNQTKINNSIKGYEDYIIEATKVNQISSTYASYVIDQYKRHKHLTIITYSIIDM